MTAALGIDVGSTNVKAVIVDDLGRIHATAQRPLTYRRDGEVTEQDAAELWWALVDAVDETTTAAPDAAAEVVAVGVCSQYSSIIPVAADGTPTAPMVMYLDQRGTGPSWEILGRHGEAFGLWVERHGIPPVGGGLSLGHILHLQHDRPEVHAATAAYLEPCDYVTTRLTGRISATQSTVFMSQLVDNRTLGVTEYDDDLLRLSGVDASRLPPLLRDGDLVGTVRPDVAELLGIPATAVVHTAMNDSHAGAYATGALTPGTVGLSIGTTAVLLDTVDRKDLDADHEVLSMPSPHPGTYVVWAENGLAGKAMEHVLEHVVHADDELADHTTDDAFARLDAALASVPAGAGGVVFLPWLAGSMSPSVDGRMRGGFVGMSLDTHRRHLVRAVAEGVAHNLAWLLPHVEAFSGHRCGEVVFGGGGARSHVWARIICDVLDRPVRVLDDPDRAISRAVALVALQRQGSLDDPDGGGLGELVVTAEALEPDARTHPVHAAVHEQFVAAYTALRPICQALSDLPPEEDPS